MKTNAVTSARQAVRCPVCLFDSEFTLSNVVGNEMSCVSCGEPIAEIVRAHQEEINVLRCQPFSVLAQLTKEK